jgi:hypothetical protein
MSTNTSFRPPPPWYSPYYPLPQAAVYTWPAPSSPFVPPVHHGFAGGVYGGSGLAAQEADSLSSASEGATLEGLSVRGLHDLSPVPPGTDINYQLPAVPLYSDCLNSSKRQEAKAVPHPRHHSSGARLVDDLESAPVVPSTRTRRRSDSNPPLPVPHSPLPYTMCKPLSWTAMGPPAPFQGVTRFSPTTLYDTDRFRCCRFSQSRRTRATSRTQQYRVGTSKPRPALSSTRSLRDERCAAEGMIQYTPVPLTRSLYMGASCLCPLSPQART